MPIQPMRRTPYTDRFERTFLKPGSLHKPHPPIELRPSSFRLDINHVVGEDPRITHLRNSNGDSGSFNIRESGGSFKTKDNLNLSLKESIRNNNGSTNGILGNKSRYNYNYNQSRLIKPSLNRPLTTSKDNSFVQLGRSSSCYKDQNNSLLEGGKARQQMQIGSFLQGAHNGNNAGKQPLFSQTRGRLYRGSSWKAEEKMYRQPNSNKYNTAASHKKYSERNNQYVDHASMNFQQKRRSSYGTSDREQGSSHNGGDSHLTSHATSSKPLSAFDLIGQNLKKSEHKQRQDQNQFFEYVLRFAYRTKKGYIPSNSSKQNQDVYIVNPNINGKSWLHLFSVCDGHGPLGHLVSNYIKATLPQCVSSSKLIDKTPAQSLQKAYEIAYSKLLKESKIDMSFSGSTVISCLLQQNKLYCANVGDSRAILGKCLSVGGQNFKSNTGVNSSNTKWSAVPLSVDHKPSLEKQAERIRRNKGRIEAYKDECGQPIGPLRVWVQCENVPGLAMTRSFGDLVAASVGVSAIPEILEFSLCQQDKIIVIGSDGVFQFLQNQQIIRSLVPYYENKQIQQASDNLLNMANRSWTKNSSIIDDITFILIFINYNEA